MKEGAKPIAEPSNAMHEFFGLSYASYLVIPRAILQSASPATQIAMREALEALRDECAEHMGEHWPKQAVIEVKLRCPETGRYVKDDLSDYQRGRRRLWHVHG